MSIAAVFSLAIADEIKADAANVKERPNVIVILADDMGYGDTSNNGHPSIRTPHLDRMASEGQKWTNFYVPASVCSPSRAGLLTDRLPVRSDVASLKHRVFFPWSKGGLPSAEMTLAEMFKAKGYQTAMFGKWHLGHLPEFLPTQQGFDTWFGVPYSNDMDRDRATTNALAKDDASGQFPASYWYEPKSRYFNVPLMENDRLLERGPDQTLLSQEYTNRSLAFIRQNQQKLFFLYLAFNAACTVVSLKGF